MEKWTHNSGNVKGIGRLCRNRIRKAKLNVATSVRYKKKDFYKCIYNKTWPKKTSILYWTWWGK